MAQVADISEYGGALEALRQRAEQFGYRTPDLRGISLGGCVEAVGTKRAGAFRRRAHCHPHGRNAGPFDGWICVLSPNIRRLVTPTGRPTALFAHEYAHLLASDGHGPRWQKAVAAIGHPNEAARLVKIGRRYYRDARVAAAS